MVRKLSWPLRAFVVAVYFLAVWLLIDYIESVNNPTNLDLQTQEIIQYLEQQAAESEKQ